jgi:hypothetical protein
MENHVYVVLFGTETAYLPIEDSDIRDSYLLCGVFSNLQAAKKYVDHSIDTSYDIGMVFGDVISVQKGEWIEDNIFVDDHGNTKKWTLPLIIEDYTDYEDGKRFTYKENDYRFCIRLEKIDVMG